ncbi:MAG TPA: glucose 1-dehydrogenase [Alphaproteobacteria bacterium]|nr:glucose 1-dehydrogenase [Alphaproteobacteria bacterium]
MQTTRFQGRIGIVTGAASGIGLATARRLAREGARLVLADIQDADAIAEELAAEGAESVFHRTDVAVASEWTRLTQSTIARFGGLDFLINNAGIPLAKTVLETSEAEWDRVIAVNLKSVFLACRAAVPFLRGRPGAAIVNVASELGLVGHATAAAYCASKGGVVQLTRAMAIDHAADGIRINAVCPGPVDTPLLDAFNQAEQGRTAVLENEAVPLLGRIGRPEEVAAAILFLASEDAGFITGSALLVDGGLTAR